MPTRLLFWRNEAKIIIVILWWDIVKNLTPWHKLLLITCPQCAPDSEIRNLLAHQRNIIYARAVNHTEYWYINYLVVFVLCLNTFLNCTLRVKILERIIACKIILNGMVYKLWRQDNTVLYNFCLFTEVHLPTYGIMGVVALFATSVGTEDSVRVSFGCRNK